MALFLTIHKGTSPLDAEPLFVTRDRKVIYAALGEMSKRIDQGLKNGSKKRADSVREPKPN